MRNNKKNNIPKITIIIISLIIVGFLIWGFSSNWKFGPAQQTKGKSDN